MKRSKLLHWNPDFPWAVPRDLTAKPPAGMVFIGAGRMVLIGRQQPAQPITPADWGEVIGSQTRALLLVCAVQGHYSVQDWPAAGHLRTNRPALVHLALGQRLTVTPADSRTGELWAFPLRPLTGPPTPPFTTHEDTLNAP